MSFERVIQTRAYPVTVSDWNGKNRAQSQTKRGPVLTLITSQEIEIAPFPSATVPAQALVEGTGPRSRPFCLLHTALFQLKGTLKSRSALHGVLAHSRQVSIEVSTRMTLSFYFMHSMLVRGLECARLSLC